jgi:hypothetical protein
MQTEKFARYVVTVPVGVRISEAMARHREETGHGGTCILRFARAEDPSSAVTNEAANFWQSP